MSDTTNQDILNQVAPPQSAGLMSSQNSPVEEPPESNTCEVTREEKSSEKDLMLLNEEVEDRKADRALREKFGDKAYKVVRKTLYGWAILLFCYGYSKVFGFTIFPDQVMIAITTAVTLNVFAAFLGVIRGLFPAGKKDKD
ncbi:hypothetical protein MUA04_00990 [Enterobacteriaceae bacterium H11S18]|uniref:hypothetical protein n=1 Tax=Dryocola clanedunensis TaxID=2925396 RepID=UPI0022F12502|nr:hypothetical protein [Dryocola clanedunensis]MCT4708811.1 hypothetical protein [Dryocola clanedunensis]